MTINPASLNPAIRRKIETLALELGKKFYKAWTFVNPKGEKFLFGQFGPLYEDFTVATIATENPYCCGGWEPIWETGA
jgi:hypothetical protein